MNNKATYTPPLVLILHIESDNILALSGEDQYLPKPNETEEFNTSDGDWD